MRLDYGYQDILKLYQQYPGPLVIAESFIANPHETISSLCDALMIDFEPIKSLKWEPIETEKLPEQFLPWYEDLSASTQIVHKKSPDSTSVDVASLDENIREAIRAN